jgi:hypothetical protein
MLLQIIYLSMDYFSYPFNIKVDINYDKQQSMPSITLCTKNNSFISKTQMKNNYPDIYSKIVSFERHYEHCLIGPDFESYNESVAHKCKSMPIRYVGFNYKLNSILNEIRDRNRNNTTLEQLFEKTLHLNESIDCKVYYKDGKVINCLKVQSLIEVFDGSNVFGKCFSHSNERQKLKTNIINEFLLSKEDYIEFTINYNNFNDIVGNNHVSEPTLFISINSQNTFVSIPNFITLNGYKYYEMSFGKKTYKSLEWPYSTDCDYYKQNLLFDSRDNCIEYCHLYERNKSNGCLTDPSTESRFSVSNRKMNLNFSHMMLCENFNKSSFLTKCGKLCKRDCYKHYYQYNCEEKNRKSNEILFLIRINAENSPNYEYKAIPKYSFILYVTSIGGLMSLWLGISAIDLRAIVKIFVEKLLKIMKNVIQICSSNNYFNKFIHIMHKIIIYLKSFKKLYLKKIYFFLSFICFIYQLIELTLEFTEYKTTTYVEIEFYKYPLFSFYKSGFRDFPSYSICDDNINFDSLKFFENHSNNINEKLLKTEKSKLIVETIIKEKNVSKYFNLVMNEFPLNMRCMPKEYAKYYSEMKDKCVQTKYIIRSLSKLGNCYTYMSGLNHFSEYEIMGPKSINFIIIYSLIKLDKSRFYNVLIHDRDQLPSLTFVDFVGTFVKQGYSMAKIKRLPPPYDSNCFDYKESKLFKSRGHCINDCIIKKILKKYNCIPTESANILTLYDNMSMDFTFCDKKQFCNLSEKGCSDQCLKPCEETIFTIIKSGLGLMKPIEDKYVIYVNNIYMTFIYYVISIGGLLGLWNNVSVYDLQLILINLLEMIINLKFMKNFSKLLNSFKISMSLGFIKVFILKLNLKVSIVRKKINFHLELFLYDFSIKHTFDITTNPF